MQATILINAGSSPFPKMKKYKFLLFELARENQIKFEELPIEMLEDFYEAKLIDVNNEITPAGKVATRV
jgi:hypothetical protein